MEAVATALGAAQIKSRVAPAKAKGAGIKRKRRRKRKAVVGVATGGVVAATAPPPKAAHQAKKIKLKAKRSIRSQKAFMWGTYLSPRNTVFGEIRCIRIPTQRAAVKTTPQ